MCCVVCLSSFFYSVNCRVISWLVCFCVFVLCKFLKFSKSYFLFLELFLHLQFSSAFLYTCCLYVLVWMYLGQGIQQLGPIRAARNRHKEPHQQKHTKKKVKRKIHMEYGKSFVTRQPWGRFCSYFPCTKSCCMATCWHGFRILGLSKTNQKWSKTCPYNFRIFQ